jgi:hypothetical protein
MILVTNFLAKAGIKLDYNSGHMQWCHSTLSMHPHKGLTSEDFDNVEDIPHTV